VLYLECLDLDLREWTIYPSVLNAVEKFVATAGVRIANLTLPSHEFDGVYEETQLRSAWAALSCTVVGIQDYRQGSRGARPSTLAGVDRLVVPSFYVNAPYFLPFFMAARDARGVKSVRIEMEEILRSRHQDYDKLFGALIGYAFFSKHSKSSITSLDLDQVAFTKLAMGAMLRVTSSDDPLQQLYQEITGVQGISQRRPISLKKGTLLRPCWESSVAKTSSPWTGTVVYDDPNKATMAVYLPGYGLCDIDRSSVPNKKQRRTTSAINSPTLLSTCPRESTRLRSLSLQLLARNDTTNNDQRNAILDVGHIVLRFADLVGASLESFGFASEDTTNDILREILNRFKKLQRLRLLDASLDDLSFFAIAYHSGCQIDSLDLSGCQIPMVVFKSLMRWLTTDETVKRTLRRLRFGKNWDPSCFTQSTVDLVTSMLTANKQLTYLHIDIPEESAMWDAVTNFQGENLGGTLLPIRHLFAAFSVFHHQNRSANSRGSFDGPLVKHVAGFLAPTKRRTVIVEAPPPPPVERNVLLQIYREMHGDVLPRGIF
jgi:hypothetical protein